MNTVCAHARHTTDLIHIRLSNPHGFNDLPQIPKHLATNFSIKVYDHDAYQGFAGYCPGQDVVSQAIRDQGCWEPIETALVLAACESDGLLIDFGAHIGWFTLLAASAGSQVVAVECDPENARVLAENLACNLLDDLVHIIEADVAEVDPIASSHSVSVVKADVEGYEAEALEVVKPILEKGMADHLLIEVSPVFGKDYPSLVCGLRGMHYIPHLIPDKQVPPVEFSHPLRDIAAFRMTGTDAELAEQIQGFDQRNLWFTHARLL